jgi:hypothetical protein
MHRCCFSQHDDGLADKNITKKGGKWYKWKKQRERNAYIYPKRATESHLVAEHVVAAS